MKEKEKIERLDDQIKRVKKQKKIVLKQLESLSKQKLPREVKKKRRDPLQKKWQELWDKLKLLYKEKKELLAEEKEGRKKERIMDKMIDKKSFSYYKGSKEDALSVIKSGLEVYPLRYLEKLEKGGVDIVMRKGKIPGYDPFFNTIFLSDDPKYMKKSYIIHETAHALDFALNIMGNEELVNALKKKLAGSKIETVSVGDTKFKIAVGDFVDRYMGRIYSSQVGIKRYREYFPVGVEYYFGTGVHKWMLREIDPDLNEFIDKLFRG